MFVAITNTPRDYAWGSTSAIPELLGTPATGQPQAELWLGTHPGSPARFSGGLLSELTTLPFLLKVLAAAAPLSLQAHPTLEQAKEGFARENSAGVPLEAPHRNYKDELHKPEIIVALTSFRALCGFRPASQTSAAIERLIAAAPGDPALRGWLDRLVSDEGIRPTFEWLLSRGDGVDRLIASLVDAARRVDGPHFELVGELEAAHPGDPGIAISLMLNLTKLQPGQGLFLPAGNIHAYVDGVGVELMAASDNVLRGGLTPKHIDIAELLNVLNFTPGPVPYLSAESIAPHVEVFQPEVREFELMVIDGPGTVALGRDAIALCTSGSFTVNGQEVRQGESLFISDETSLTFDGAGRLFVATTPAPR